DAADLSGAAAARIERPLMGRDEQDVGVVPEDRLRAVAVVDVPVDDGYSLAATAKGRGHHGHVVQETETHRVIAQRVVARWSHRDESDCVIVPAHLGDHARPGTGGA